MSQKIFAKPTDAELEILQLIWEHGPSPVRFVNEELNKLREIGYTTTLKMMQLMYEKGLLLRDESSRTHVYSAAVKEGDTQRKLLDIFVDSTYRGSAMTLVMQALGNHKASREELDELKSLIEKLEKKG